MLAVFTNAEGLVLIAERATPRGAWQFPQGGIDPGESPVQALYREMLEEIGCGEFDVVRRSGGAIRYDFPAGLDTPIGRRYRGQDQIWFLVRLRPGARPDLSRATHEEFVDMAWVSVEEALRRAVDFKRAAYQRGLTELGLAGGGS